MFSACLRDPSGPRLQARRIALRMQSPAVLENFVRPAFMLKAGSIPARSEYKSRSWLGLGSEGEEGPWLVSDGSLGGRISCCPWLSFLGVKGVRCYSVPQSLSREPFLHQEIPNDRLDAAAIPQTAHSEVSSSRQSPVHIFFHHQ